MRVRRVYLVGETVVLGRAIDEFLHSHLSESHQPQVIAEECANLRVRRLNVVVAKTQNVVWGAPVYVLTRAAAGPTA